MKRLLNEIYILYIFFQFRVKKPNQISLRTGLLKALKPITTWSSCISSLKHTFILVWYKHFGLTKLFIKTLVLLWAKKQENRRQFFFSMMTHIRCMSHQTETNATRLFVNFPLFISDNTSKKTRRITLVIFCSFANNFSYRLLNYDAKFTKTPTK